MNEPPRYQPSRALPERAYVPGLNERPAIDPSPVRETEHAQYLWGVDLYNNGFFWEAHEAWESLWRAAEHDVVQHAFLQALILCAAACLKGVQHDGDAAKRIAARALERLERVQSERLDSYLGLELEPFSRAFRSFVDRDPTEVASRPRIILRGRDRTY